jgi:hypothetical protein
LHLGIGDEVSATGTKTSPERRDETGHVEAAGAEIVNASIASWNRSMEKSETIDLFGTEAHDVTSVSMAAHGEFIETGSIGSDPYQ